MNQCLGGWAAWSRFGNSAVLSITHAPIVAQGVASNMQGLDQSVTLYELFRAAGHRVP
jgi:hypothetical protein